MKKAKLFATMLLALVMSFALLAFSACVTILPNESDTTSGSTTDLPGDTGDVGDTGDTGETPDEDVTAPVITLDTTETNFTANLGEDFVLPKATVTDDSEGEIYTDIFSNPFGAIKDIEEGIFNSATLGYYVVTYYASDESDNETYLDIIVNVVSDTYAETYDTEGYDDISALAEDGGIYKENFADGLNSALIIDAMQVGEIKAGEQALNGNSIVMDYASLEGQKNQFFLSNLSPYIRSGKWTITFDVKLVSGTAFSDFYFGYVKEGEVDSTDQQYSLEGMQVGDVRTITYSQLLSLDDTATYWFHFFKYSQSGDAVIAIDNFTFEYEEKIYTTVYPSIEELQAGYTYDWTNNYMAFTAGEPIAVEEIENEEAKAAITGASTGFSDTVIHLTGGGQHNLTVFHKDNNADYFQKGWTYIFSFSYYANSFGQNYFIALDGSQGNNAFYVSPIAAEGLNTAEIEYNVAANDFSLTLYGSMDVYLGNFSIKLLAPDVERTDYHAVTNEETLAEGGYTWDWSENNIAQFSNSKYFKLSTMADTELAATLAETGAFTEGYALRFNAHSYLECLTNNLTVGNIYTVTFTAYAKVDGTPCILLMNAGSQQGRADFTKTVNENGTTTYTTSFLAKEEYESVYFYVVSTLELYLANLTVAQTIPAEDDGLVDKIVAGVKSASDLNQYGKGTLVDTPEAAAGQEGFGAQALKISGENANANFELTNFAALTTNDVNYKKMEYTVYYYVESVNGDGQYRINIDNAQFPMLDSTVGYHTATFSTESPVNYFCFYFDNFVYGTVYLGSVEYAIYTRGEPSAERTDYYAATDEQLLAEGGYTWDWSENNLLKINTNATYVAINEQEEALAKKLGETGSFTEGYALKLAGTGSSYVDFLSGKINNKNTYTLTFTAYEVNAGAVMLLLMTDAGGQVGTNTFEVTANANGTRTYTATFKAAANYYYFNLYIQTACEMYISEITISQVAYVAPEVELVEKTTTATFAPADLNDFGKGTLVGTPEAAAGKEGFGEQALKISGETANVTYELTRCNDITSIENFVKITFNVYYYVESVVGSGTFRLRCDSNFPSLDSTVGYHVAEITIEGPVDYLCIYFDGSVYGTLYVGKIDYTVTYMGEPEMVEKTTTATFAPADLNDFGKGTLVGTPEAAAGKEGFGEQALKISGETANVTYELTRCNDITSIENFVKITFNVYYYVESVVGSGAFRLRCDGNFPQLDSTVGYHVAEITIEGPVDYLCIYFDGSVYGTLYVGKIDYTVTYVGY